MTKDVISLSISVLLLFRHYISHKITFGAPSSGGVLCSARGAFILLSIGSSLNREKTQARLCITVTDTGKREKNVTFWNILL